MRGERAVGQQGDRGRIEVGGGGIVERAPLVVAFPAGWPIQPTNVPGRTVYSSLIAMMRPSASAVMASMPPLPGWRADVGGAGERRGCRRQRLVAPQPVMTLEADQPRAVGQARHALGIGFGLAVERLAVEVVSGRSGHC